jgi:OmpA-OmpF porin, OOP family
MAAGCLAAACATPAVRPVDVQPIAAGPGEKVVVDQSVVIIDSSSSVRSEFPTEKALSQSLVSSMPAGDYKAGAIQFGGVHRNVYPVGTFDRSGMAGYAADMSQIGEGTPIYNSFDEAAGALASVEGHTAVTVISDGVFTDVGGRPVSDESVMAAARGLASKSNGEVCFHTVQVGSDKEGAENLQKLANLTDCGSFRPASSLTTASAIQSFQREVYLAAAPKPVAKAVPGDADGDGVLDNSDQCPNTPRGARVDPRGCWVPADIFFALNSDKMDQTSKELLLQRGMPILKQNPDLRVRIDGYTDSSGTEAYNQQLSQRRAEAVRKFFIDNGIAPRRLEARGFGESNPAYPNDSPANMAKNRRVEFTPL